MVDNNKRFDHDRGIADLTRLETDVLNRQAEIGRLAAEGATQEEITAAHLANLRAIGDAARELAVSTGLEAAERGLITYTETAELLHVHPITIGRWMQRRRAGEPLNHRPTPRERR